MRNLCFVLGLLVIVGCGRPQPEPQKPVRPASTVQADAALCTTDQDCDDWEVRNNIPMSQRSFGAPVPATAANPAYHAESIRCTATTKAGAQCKRTTKVGNRCFQHREQVAR